MGFDLAEPHGQALVRGTVVHYNHKKGATEAEHFRDYKAALQHVSLLEWGPGCIDRVVVLHHIPATCHFLQRAGIVAFHTSTLARNDAGR